MGHNVIVEHYPELDFQRSQIQSSTTLLSVKSVRIGQHVTVKAKGTNMSKELKGGDLTLVNCTLLDPTASMKMVLWENFINQVENNRTYIFHNVTVRKDKYNDTIYLNTSQYGAIYCSSTFGVQQLSLEAKTQTCILTLVCPGTGTVL